MRDWDKITRLIHQCWVSYQIGAGQPFHPDPTPDDLRSNRIGAEFMLENPAAGPSAQHDKWMETRLADGWVYGPVKDTAKKQHPDLVPYESLPWVERMKDHNFQMACRLALQLFPPA